MPPLTALPAAPKEANYTPLAEHQEQTPGSFFAGKAVLHCHLPSATVKLSKQEFLAQEELRALVEKPEDLEGDEEGLVSVGEVGVWIGSGDLRLWSESTSKGVVVPYPSITVHALLGPAVLLELNLSDAATTPEEDIEHLTLRLLPTTTTESGDESSALYKAIGDCQELNPDPMDQDSDEEGGEAGFDETAPGATGWITSENMGEFVDEEGNFKMPEGVTVYGEQEGEALGEGAGRVRRAEELDGEAEAEREEEGKWQKTG